MGPLITKVLAFLETLDDLDLTVTDDSITVKETSKTGYTVTLWEDQAQTYVVNYGHYWHDHYSSEVRLNVLQMAIGSGLIQLDHV
jgi:hypothetical protein